jgi:hypothetical protein
MTTLISQMSCSHEGAFCIRGEIPSQDIPETKVIGLCASISFSWEFRLSNIDEVLSGYQPGQMIEQ